MSETAEKTECKMYVDDTMIQKISELPIKEERLCILCMKDLLNPNSKDDFDIKTVENSSLIKCPYYESHVFHPSCYSTIEYISTDTACPLCRKYEFQEHKKFYRKVLSEKNVKDIKSEDLFTCFRMMGNIKENYETFILFSNIFDSFESLSTVYSSLLEANNTDESKNFADEFQLFFNLIKKPDFFKFTKLELFEYISTKKINEEEAYSLIYLANTKFFNKLSNEEVMKCLSNFSLSENKEFNCPILKGLFIKQAFESMEDLNRSFSREEFFQICSSAAKNGVSNIFEEEFLPFSYFKLLTINDFIEIYHNLSNYDSESTSRLFECIGRLDPLITSDFIKMIKEITKGNSSNEKMKTDIDALFSSVRSEKLTVDDINEIFDSLGKITDIPDSCSSVMSKNFLRLSSDEFEAVFQNVVASKNAALLSLLIRSWPIVHMNENRRDRIIDSLASLGSDASNCAQDLAELLIVPVHLIPRVSRKFVEKSGDLFITFLTYQSRGVLLYINDDDMSFIIKEFKKMNKVHLLLKIRDLCNHTLFTEIITADDISEAFTKHASEINFSLESDTFNNIISGQILTFYFDQFVDFMIQNINMDESGKIVAAICKNPQFYKKVNLNSITRLFNQILNAKIELRPLIMHFLQNLTGIQKMCLKANLLKYCYLRVNKNASQTLPQESSSFFSCCSCISGNNEEEKIPPNETYLETIMRTHTLLQIEDMEINNPERLDDLFDVVEDFDIYFKAFK